MGFFYYYLTKANTYTPVKKPFVQLAKILAIVLMVFAGWKVLEYVSYRILLKKGLVAPGGAVNKQIYSRKLNFWAVSQNATNHYIDAYDNNFKKNCQLYMDGNGFITGDTTDLQKQKPANTIRIFLTGGSAMFGSLATLSVTKSNAYPEGSYCYKASIAGHLKQLLVKAHPELNFEVVNAAIVQHQFNQNYAMYYQRFHDYHPDVIINMDGYNDRWPVRGLTNGGDPYLGADGQIDEELNLEVLQRASGLGYTAMLVGSWLLQQPKKNSDSPKQGESFISTWHAEDVRTMLNELKDTGSNNNYSPEKYAMIDSYMNTNWQKELWLIKSYEEQLAADSVYSIFCLQPMLARYYAQKPLTNLEQQLLAACRNYQNKHISIDSLLRACNQKPNDALNAYYQLGDALPLLDNYYMQYYINQIQSPTLSKVVQQSGGHYIDMNVETQSIPAEQEFYTDYCHLTPYGNHFVAEQFAERVEKYLTTKKLSTPSSTK